jgi:hypothetical protein
MRSSILRPDEGFDIIVNGVDRSFRDREEVGYALARYLKEKWPKLPLINVLPAKTATRHFGKRGLG